MDIVTGHVGSAHVTSWQDRDLNQGIFGPDTYILNVGSKLAATIISNNEIRIADGVLVMQGCQGVIQKGTYDTISIDNGTQGLKRNDLICAQYTKSAGVESMSLVVIKGTAASTPVDPSYTSGDIQNGDTPVQVPIYRAVLNGLTLESVTALVDTVQGITGMGDLYTDSWSGSFPDNSALGGAYITVPKGLYLVLAEAYFSGATLNSLNMIITTNPYPADVVYYNDHDWGDEVAGNYAKTAAIYQVNEPAELIVSVTQRSGSARTGSTQITAVRIK